MLKDFFQQMTFQVWQGRIFKFRSSLHLKIFFFSSILSQFFFIIYSFYNKLFTAGGQKVIRIKKAEKSIQNFLYLLFIYVCYKK